MKRKCAWCGQGLELDKPERPDSTHATHGICHGCRSIHFGWESLKEDGRSSSQEDAATANGPSNQAGTSLDAGETEKHSGE